MFVGVRMQFLFRRSTVGRRRVHALAAALLGLCCLFAAPPPTAAQTSKPARAQTRTSYAPMLKRVMPAVVNIAVVGQVPLADSPLLDDPLFRRRYQDGAGQLPQSVPQQSAGSGVIVDAARGYVVTNHHVVDSSDEIIVTLSDRRRFNAQLVGSDTETDIALLKIDADRLTQVEVGNSDALEVGDFVVAIGNPFGLGQTVTSGIVSALRRSELGIEGYEDFIQTDAPINPGNSGGALVDVDGKLVGVNTAIVSPGNAEGSVGIGFAVPMKMVQRVTAQLVEYGEVRRGRLGVGIQDVTPDLAKALKLGVEAGAIITQVEPDSSASRAGVKVDDVVVDLDGAKVAGAADLRNSIGLTPVGTEVSIGLVRDSRRQTIKLTVEQGPPHAAHGGSGGGDIAAGKMLDGLRGAELADPSETGNARGVVVSQVDDGSPAALNGLADGDVITAVNRHAVHTVQDFAAALRGASTPLALSVVRDGEPLYIVVR
jgi:Do/DeqQ family serine protease